MLNRGFEFFETDGFYQMFGEACFDTPLHITIHSKAANRDPRDSGFCAQPGHQFQAAAIRQADIADKKIELNALRSFDRRMHVVGRGHTVTAACQQSFQGGSGVGMVIDEQNAKGALAPGRWGSGKLCGSLLRGNGFDREEKARTATTAITLSAQRAAVRLRD